MAGYDWQDLLTRLSKDIVRAVEYRDVLPSEVMESGWLGYQGATEAQIVQAEVRLGSTLPPSYREFLKVTNGWRMTGPFIHKLWSTEEIEWHYVRRKDLLEAIFSAREYYGGPEVIPDGEYFVYGADQDSTSARVEYLRTALEVSDYGDSAIYLLNPQVVTSEGEWEAWFSASWLPGAHRYRSFWDLMQAEYENFLRLQDT